MRYRTGGGSQGNVQADEIKTLKGMIPSIDSVKNVEQGEGGSDVQSPIDAMQRWPSLVKNRRQAVTSTDFENLVEGRFKSVSRVKCFSTTDKYGKHRPGHVLVIVIPKLEDNKNKGDGNTGDDNNSISQDNEKKTSSPISLAKTKNNYPSMGLIENIKSYLEKVSSNIVVFSNHIHVRGPVYYGVSVTAKVYVKSIDDVYETRAKALGLLSDFLNPQDGGVDRKGWDFGKILYPSDFYWLISQIKQVHHIENVSIKFRNSELDDPRRKIVQLFEDINESREKHGSAYDTLLPTRTEKELTSSFDYGNNGILDEDMNSDQIVMDSFIINDGSFNQEIEDNFPKHGLIYDAGNHSLEVLISP